jgi:two-component system phosphate regulon sensor histidine kinase PhoR
MQATGFCGIRPSRPPAGSRARDGGLDGCRDRQRAADNFPATLLAMAGHDLRQPLQVITNAHDVLAGLVDNGPQREELARVENATAQLAGMLGQLVEALQLHQRANGHFHVPVPLRPVLDELALELGGSARLKGVAFRVTSASGEALSHPVLLIGMLRNLIRNAIQYTPPGGAVSVASYCFGSELRIEVSDTGAGMRPEALTRVFRAFQRADESRADGLGLGLFIVKHAADLLGHRIEVRSAEGRGSCFTVVAKRLDTAPSRGAGSGRAAAPAQADQPHF